MQRIKEYLYLFKSFFVRGGNELKKPKFHQMLHVVNYIQKYGCSMNYDRLCGQNIGKTNIKDNAKRTNQEKNTLHCDIGTRIVEVDVVDHVLTQVHKKMSYLPSKFWNENDLLNKSNAGNRYLCASNDHSPRRSFTFNCGYSDINDYDE